MTDKKKGIAAWCALPPEKRKSYLHWMRDDGVGNGDEWKIIAAALEELAELQDLFSQLREHGCDRCGDDTGIAAHRKIKQLLQGKKLRPAG
jgi:hypothetical protein